MQLEKKPESLDDTKCLPCIECGQPYSERDIALHNYFAQTQTCYRCYEQFRSLEHRENCFGKYDLRSRRTGKIVRFGFDPEAFECEGICPDRKQCELFASGLITIKRQEARQGIT